MRIITCINEQIIKLKSCRIEYIISLPPVPPTADDMPPLEDVTATANASKLAHAVLSDPSPIGMAACELVEEFTLKIEKVKRDMETAATEHENLRSAHSELRQKYHNSTNANAKLRSENSRLKREIAALRKKEEKEPEEKEPESKLPTE